MSRNRRHRAGEDSFSTLAISRAGRWLGFFVIAAAVPLQVGIKFCSKAPKPMDIPSDVTQDTRTPEPPTPRIVALGQEGIAKAGFYDTRIGVTLVPMLTIREEVSVVDRVEVHLRNYSEDHAVTIRWSTFLKACRSPAGCLGSRHDREAMLVDTRETVDVAAGETKTVMVAWRYFRGPPEQIPTGLMHYSFGCYVFPKDCIAFAKRIGDDEFAKAHTRTVR